MWLEDFIPSESWNNWPWSAEVSEKFKESVKKSAAWIKRVQKDEKKAKKYDILLAHFLVEIIKNPKYDFLLKDLFASLDAWFPSNFLLWILSLIYEDISHHIRWVSAKNVFSFDYVPKEEKQIFSPNTIDTQIQKRINFWIEDIVDVLLLESSTLQIKNMLEVMQDEKISSHLSDFTSQTFQFFFQELNIELSLPQSHSYCEFILAEVFKKIKNIPFEEV